MQTVRVISMNISVIRPFLIIGSVAFLFYLVERRAERFHPAKVEGHKFRYGSLPLTLLFAIDTVFVWGFLSESTGIRWLFFGLFLLVSSLLVYLFLTSVVLSAGVLRYKSLFRTTSIPLESIAEISKEDQHDRYVIQDQQGNRIVLSQFISGVKVLAIYLREKTGEIDSSR